MRALTVSLITVGMAALVAIWSFGATRFDQLMNRMAADPSAPVPTTADEAFHRSLFIADLHADTLKWQRDLLERSSWGHLDLPRLVEGNVALQVFTIVTKSPILLARAGHPGERCASAGSFDFAPLLAALQGRPAFSIRERALYQVRRLKDAARRSRERVGPKLRLITDVHDLRRLIADRRAGKQVIGAILGIEGGHWIGDPQRGPETVDEDMLQLFEAGVRQFAPTHRFDNDLAGSSQGCERYGLTPLGRRALETAERLGMAVDLAHISPRGLRDAIEVLRQPFTVSHTGVEAVCAPPCSPARNLSDEDIALILRHDGLIGVGYWPRAIGPSVWGIADAMAHIMDIALELGLEPGRHVALGSDFDGSVTPFFDVSRLDVLTAVMRRRAEPFDELTIRNIAGLNACRFFARVLPGGSTEAAYEICDDAKDAIASAGGSGD